MRIGKRMKMKMRHIYLALMMVMMVGAGFGQTSTITATLTDSDSQTWNNGTYALQLISSTNQSIPQGQAFRIDTGATVTTTIAAAALSGSGAFSTTLINNTNITPAGTRWQFTICSNTLPVSCGTTSLSITTSTSISSQLSAAITAPRIGGGTGTQGYADVEANAVNGNQYYNVTSSVQRCYASSAWGLCGSGAGGPPTGAAGGALGGTYPNPTVTGAIAPSTINGLSPIPITAGTTTGTTYYVDSVLGLDANNGTSQATPWKTIAHVNAQTFTSGSQILFLSTSVWHEQLTIPSSSITIGAYGPQRDCSLSATLVAYCKNMPIIDGSDAVTGWTLVTGTTYSSPYTSTASKGFVDSLYAQTNALTLQTSLGNVESTAGSIFSNGTLVYVNLLDGSNPANHSIEVAGSRKYGIYTNGASTTTVNGIEIIRTAKTGYLNYGPTTTGTGNSIQSSVLFNNADTLSDASLSGNIEGAIFTLAQSGQSNVTGFSATGNWVGEIDFTHATPNFTMAGIQVDGMTAPSVTNNKIATVNGNAMRVQDYFYAPFCSAPVINGNEMTNSEGNINLAGCPNATIEYNLVRDSFGNGMEIGTGLTSSDLSTAPYVGFNTIKHIRAAFTNSLYNGIDVNYATGGIATGNTVFDVAQSNFTLEADVSASSGWIVNGNQLDASQNTYLDGTTPTTTNRVYPFYIRNTSLSGGLTMRGNTLVTNSNAGSYVAKYGATSAGDQTHDVLQPAFDVACNGCESPGSSFAALHYLSGGSTPTALAGTGAGAGPPTVTMAGTDTGGSIILTAGTSPATFSPIVTVTFATPFTGSAQVHCTISAGAAVSNISGIFISSVSDTAFVISSGGTALNGTNFEEWFYTCGQ